MVRHCISHDIKKNRLEYLKQALQEQNIIVEITSTRLERKGGKIFLFITVGKPDFGNPIEQAKANPSIPESQSGNVLDENSRRFLQHLCDERVTQSLICFKNGDAKTIKGKIPKKINLQLKL